MQEKINKKRLWVSIFLASLVLIWLDFFVGNALSEKKPLLLGIYDVSFLGYSLAVYPLLLLSFLTIPIILYPERWKLWIFVGLMIWTLNDALWFVVRPDEWIKFWFFKGEVIFKWCLINNEVCIYPTDCLMAFSIITRLLIGIYIYKKWIQGRACSS